MQELKICLADEPVNLDLLSQMVDFPHKFELLGPIKRCDTSRVTHGTLCMILLLNALQGQGIIDQVTISHFSLADKESNLSYAQLLNVFDYCLDSEIDILSLSVGTTDRRNLDGMVEEIAKLDRTLIVAAASNSFTLTYPAALPNVLGVRRSLKKGAPMFTKRENPPDGIDLIANLPRNDILQKIALRYEELFANSNSVVVPPIVAKIAKKSITYKQIPTKEFALAALTGSSHDSDFDEYELPNLLPVAEDEKLPIVLLPCQVDIGMMNKAIALQSEFGFQGYSCGLICQNQVLNDFVNGRYQLDLLRPNDCLRYYQEVVSESLILVLGNKRYQELPAIDLCVDKWQDMAVPILYSYILSKFDESSEMR